MAMVENKSLSLEDEVRGMTTRQLAMELQIVRHHIDYLSYGQLDLVFEDLLVAELTRRDALVPEWESEEQNYQS